MATLTLRHWQQQAFEQHQTHLGDTFLAVATPGAGKTTFALVTAAHHLADNPDHRLVVVAPTAHLRHQWAVAAARLGITLLDQWSPADGPLPADVHGLVTTYQQVAANPHPFAPAAPRAFVILDELHHAGATLTWGEALAAAFAASPHKLALSGTPFRSDDNPIPFLTYQNGQARADYIYNYQDALADQVVRPVQFPLFDGEMEWISARGDQMGATFTDDLPLDAMNQRLRTAVSPTGQWLPHVLSHAASTLDQLRFTHHDAGGLVICHDQDHARQTARMLQERSGTPATLALSDDPGAHHRIEQFAHSTSRWLVAVRMVSEGVDIPRLRVAVYATTTTTELYFRQAVGRVVRSTGDTTPAVVYLPADPRLAAHADRLHRTVTHQLTAHEIPNQNGVEPLPETQQLRRAEQLQLPAGGQYQPVRSTAADSAELAVLHLQSPRPAAPGIEIELPTLTTQTTTTEVGNGPTRSIRSRQLRSATQELVRELADTLALPARTINRELNRRTHLTGVRNATLEQLELRRTEADRWLEELAAGPPVRF